MKTQTAPHTNRLGFTLLEVLIVIVIISVLIGLVGIGLSNARQGVGVAETIIEFSQLETAIAAFESEFGVAPYSEITLFEKSTEWTSAEKAKIRKLWPDFPFNDLDVNGNNTPGETGVSVTLIGSEALVFLLGGMQPATGDTTQLVGFSTNPFNPFDNTSGSRLEPFYKFDSSRLTDFYPNEDLNGNGVLDPGEDLNGNGTLDLPNGFFEYHGVNTPDPQFGDYDPIVYVSSNSGRGYSDTAGSVNFYRGADGNTGLNRDTYQLIAPGADGKLGFDLLIGAAPEWSADVGPSGGTSAPDQADNITNFSEGVLGN